MSLQEYKCPSCGGAIAFDSGIQKMKCPYCDTEFEMKDLIDLDKQLDDTDGNLHDHEHWSDEETKDMVVFGCKSCGGEIAGDSNMAATSCPFCGNPVVVMGQFKGDLKPNYIIPFKLDKKAAKEKLENHLKGKRLLPKIFKDKNRIEEIKGIYVPFWLFDAKANADINYTGTKVRHWSDSKYNYTETSIYDVKRAGDLKFSKVPVDGSSKIDDDLMESIEPFDYKDIVEFQTPYLAGYFADRYDVSQDESVSKANERIKNSTESKIRETASGYTTLTPKNTDINLNEAKSNYALLPVWLLTTSWEGNKYTFAMNGQTGRFIGDLPMDKKAYWRWFGIVMLVTAIIIYGLARTLI